MALIGGTWFEKKKNKNKIDDVGGNFDL